MSRAMIVTKGGVHLQGQAGHVQDHAGDVGDVHHGFRAGFAIGLGDAFGEGGGHVGQGVADVDLGTGDVEGTAVQAEGAGQAGDGVFRHGVGRAAGARHMGRDRAVVDDPAPARGLTAHQTEGGAGAEEYAGYVGAADLQPAFDRDFVDRRGGGGDTCVVEKHVEAGKSGEGGLNLGGVAHVGGQDAGFLRARGFLQRLAAATEERDLPAFGEKKPGGGAADARPRAGDQDRAGHPGTCCRKWYFASQSAARATTATGRRVAAAISASVAPEGPLAA